MLRHLPDGSLLAQNSIGVLQGPNIHINVIVKYMVLWLCSERGTRNSAIIEGPTPSLLALSWCVKPASCDYSLLELNMYVKHLKLQTSRPAFMPRAINKKFIFHRTLTFVEPPVGYPTYCLGQTSVSAQFSSSLTPQKQHLSGCLMFKLRDLSAVSAGQTPSLASVLLHTYSTFTRQSHLSNLAACLPANVVFGQRGNTYIYIYTHTI